MMQPPDMPQIVLVERIDQMRRDLLGLSTRQDRTDQRLERLQLLPDRVERIQADVTKIESSVAIIARDWQEQDQWRQSFKLQVDALQETRMENIKGSYVTMLVLGAGAFTTLVGVLVNVALKLAGK